MTRETDPSANGTHNVNSPGATRRRLPRGLIAALVVLVLVGAGWFVLRPGERARAELFTGYVVSEDVTMTAPVSGTLTRVAVRRGQRVQAGQPLFDVDPTVRAAQAEQAGALIAAGQAQLLQQQAALGRAQADGAAAQADVERAAADWQRLAAAQRDKAGAVAQLQIDQAAATLKAATARRDAARAAVGSATAAVGAARAQLQQARAGSTSARYQLGELAPKAPSAGRVEDVMYQAGESVAANAPVVTLVPDGDVKLRFYVPQAVVSQYRPGRTVAIGCDGCAAGMTATVDFVATRPEYTPPIIYSLDARQKLVWMVEARPSDPNALLPGQPIDVGATRADLQRR